tara:strand:+ start:356 stop:661 length:306 start_codon:yes stop_codon:yes gene_type:complete
MAYKIKPLQRKKAKALNLIIKPSKNKMKKVDVFDKDGNKLASIGGVRRDGTYYGDYATFIKEKGKEKADKIRLRYLKRHRKEPKEKDGKKTPSWYADNILW